MLVCHFKRTQVQMLPSGARAGFFIGDGAGVGKGRQISGIVCDNYCRGRTKHVWISTSTDLHADAVRDLRDLGMQLPVINNCAALDGATKVGGLSKDFQEGVLFLTYSTLVSGGRGGVSRFEQVFKWLGGADFDGCLIFDECHRCAMHPLVTCMFLHGSVPFTMYMLVFMGSLQLYRLQSVYVSSAAGQRTSRLEMMRLAQR